MATSKFQSIQELNLARKYKLRLLATRNG